MNNRIQPGLNTPFNPYERVGAARKTAPPDRVEQHPGEQHPAAPLPAKDAAPDAILTDAEQHLIDRYFPASDKLTLRLYGPGRSRVTVTPNAVGKRVDVRG